MKKTISWLLAVAMVVALLPAGLFDVSAKAATSGYFTYTISNGKAIITDCSCDYGKVTIPSTLGGCPVTTINSEAFQGSYIDSITIPDSVSYIGAYAFMHCRIKNIVIPNGVTRICEGTFMCSSLESITIPESVVIIENSAFFDCSSLSTVYCRGASKPSIVPANIELQNATWYYKSCINSVKHTYTNDCDASCNACSEVRNAPHAYENDCDAICNGCSEVREVGPHIHDNGCDTTCNVCGFIRSVPDHVYEWVVDKAATCIASGIKHEECIECGFKRNENTIIDPTGQCEFTVNNNYTCKHCKKSLAPAKPEVDEVMANSVTLKEYELLEYSKDGITWQSSNFFGGLIPATEYTFYQRIAQSDVAMASEKSEAAKVSTKTGYTIAYDANGGSGAPSAQTKTDGVDLKLSSTTPTISGYNFSGWATTKYGKVVYSAGSTYSEDKDIVLYARYNVAAKSCNTCGGDGIWATTTEMVPCSFCGGVATSTKDCNHCTDGKIVFFDKCKWCDQGYKKNELGEVVLCYICDTRGYFERYEDCPYCMGAGGHIIKCGQCGGEGVESKNVSIGCSICDGNGNAYITNVSLLSNPNKLIYMECKDELDLSGGKLKISYNDGTSREVELFLAVATGFDNTKLGSQEITVAYSGKSASFEITVVEKEPEPSLVTSISVTTKPTKLIYVEGESLDTTGMIVTAYLNNNTSKVITGYVVSGYTSTEGTKKIIVTYGQFSDSFEVEVVREVSTAGGLAGDLTGDDKINSLDGLMLLRYLNGWTVNVSVPDAMDVNADGKVNSLDGLMLLRYLNGWNIKLG